MAPVRVGFIGLSKAGWARNAHLPYLQASQDYEIVALCNSTVESAKAAIELYALGEGVAAYGDPEDIAHDANIDLVVCSVRVDRHLETIAPSLKAGKDVYVEWPLGKSAAEAREILRLQKEGGGKRAIVGLQGREAPSVKKLKEVIESGRIGKVLSSTWAAQGSHLGPTGLEAFAYMGDKPVGGNIVTIHFGHAIDYIQTVLGYGFSSSSALLANRRTTWDVTQNDGSVVPKPLTADDTIFLHGTLAKGEVPLSATLRGGPVFPGTPGLDWRIYGEKGEVRLSAGGPFLQIGYEDIKIEVFDFASGKAEVVEVADDEEALALPARNVTRVYKALVKGEATCSFEDAVERHEFIEKMYKENGYVEA